MPHLPVWITEWSSQNPAFIADTMKNCIGLAEAMSYWTFSNVFEENGVPSGIFNGTFGMLDQWGIARPSLHTFSLLHKLGENRLRTSDGPVLATRRADGSEMGMRGVYREVVPPEKVVTTESWGGDWPDTINSVVLSEDDGKTTVTHTILYTSKEARDAVLGSGMTSGMAKSIDRLAEYLRESA